MFFQMKNSKKRIVIYIDGSNLYFSVKKTFNIKIDIEKFREQAKIYKNMNKKEDSNKKDNNKNVLCGMITRIKYGYL